MSLGEEWAHSLVGRDWEIFWDNGEGNGGEKGESSTPAEGEGGEKAVPMDVDQAASSEAIINSQALMKLNEILPPLMPGEYDAIVPTTPSGLLMNVKGVEAFVAFNGYKKFPDGSKGPAELLNSVRRVGDKFIAVDGASTIGKSFEEVIRMLRESAKTKYVFVRFRGLPSPSPVGTDDKVNVAKNTRVANSAQEISSVPLVATVGGSPAAKETFEKNRTEEESGEDSDESEISDWYDGRILSYKCTEQGPSFEIQFVGEGQIYTMNLTRSLVRPSARAWLVRTKALLSSRELERWEESLPVDTAALEDWARLQDLRRKIRERESSAATCPQKSNGDCVSRPTCHHYNSIQRLRYFIQAQIYLRTKLAPIVDIGEKDENEPTEAYVIFLVKCLEKLDSACEWYNKCWLLSQQVFAASESSTLLDPEFLRKGCIETGRDEIVNLMAMDIKPSGRKRQPALPPPGVRRTKRRRIQRDFSSKLGCSSTDEDGDYFSDLGDELFFSNRAVERFAKKARPELGKWFENYFLGMLTSISHHIQEPLENWTRSAECILGERQESYDDQSSTGTSVEDREEGDGEEDDEAMEEEEKIYSYQDVKEILDLASIQQVLRKMDLSRWTSKLNAKLRLVEEFEAEAWKLVSKVVDETNTQGEPDAVLAGLANLKIQTDASDSLLGNVAPLGKSPASKMTKEVVEDSYAVRQWVVDLTQAERQRERVTFIQDVVARAPNLPHIPSIPGEATGESSLSSKLGEVVARVQHVSADLFSNVQIVTQYERDLAQSSDPLTDCNGLRNLDGINKALGALALIPVLSLVEEKLAVRKDLLLWVAEVKPFLSNSTGSLPFEEVERHHKSLTNILCGTSTGRNRLIVDLTRKEVIEKEVRQFSKVDVDVLSENIGPKLEALYLQAAAWKERAEAIITALRVHGNTTAGEPLYSSKTLAMVDCKRMSDLLHEYRGFDVSIAEEYDIVQAAYKEAIAWSQRVTTVVDQEQDLLGCLSTCRNERPIGVMVDPSRHTLDLIVELLEWHNKVKKVTKLVISLGKSAEHRDLTDIYLLILEGLEVIEQYAQERKGDNNFTFAGEKLLAFITRTLDSTRPTKGIVLSKMESAPVGKQVIQRLVSASFDATEAYPLFSILHLVWAAGVSEFVSNATAATVRTRPALQDAVALALIEPKVPDIDTNLLMDDRLENAVTKLLSLIEESKGVEAKARKMTSPDKETFRGSLQKADEVREHLASLKDIQYRYKSPKQGGQGLILDAETEKSIDGLIKDLSWLVRTLAYPVLHSDNAEVTAEERIPWSELVNLCDRIPPAGDEIVGDIPRVALRVRELHEAADMWQQEVSSLLSLSIRGAKRRHVSSQEGEPDGQEGQPKVSNVQLAELVKDPILKSISIPRESAVREVLSKAREFELLMYDLLGKDFSGAAADKAPYPEASSLVGTDDEFHLYRLTGNPLFSSVQATVEKLSRVSADIAADTPGKEVFEWINQCVKWIDTLNHAVTEESPFGRRDRLVVPVDEAVRILEVGNQLFLEISDDIRKTLSTQRIIVSTNKQSEKLTVTIAKGGAHHSAGGTAIKWCPLIFDWLKNDFDEHHQWAERAKAIVENGRGTAASWTKPTDVSQDDVNKAYHCVENLMVHLDEGRDSLVVVPGKPLIDQMRSLHNTIEDRIKSCVSESNGALSLDTAKVNRYDNSSVLIHEKHKLLDALLIRRRIQPSGKREPATLPTTAGDFREKARIKLENKVMKKGMRMMGLRTQGAKDVALHCSLKAWEIESAAFSAYHEGEKSVKSQYTSKLTSFFNNLDALKNPTLCARVLANELTAQDLLEMTTDEMASQDVRDKKAKAEADSKKNVIVAAGKTKSPDPKRKTVKNLLKMSGNSAALSPKGAFTSPSSGTRLANLNVGSLAAPSLSHMTASAIMHSSRFSPPPNGDNLTLDPLAIAAAVQALQRKPAAAPPPPPPPLVAQASIQFSPPARHGTGGAFVESQSGSDKFTFIMAGDQKYTFQAKLIMEDDSYPDIDGFLNDSISSKGRLQADGFSNFISSKMKSGRSTIVALRMSVCDGGDHYRLFYKEYENRKRIAMCELDSQTKLFLVTPKFHSAAKKIQDQLTHRTSTYAVLVTKRADHFY